VWSVGRRRGRLYLGSRVALLQVAEHALVILEYPPTLPLTAALQQLALKSKEQGIDLSSTMLDVDLSAALCKGVVLASSFNPRDLAKLTLEMRQELTQQLPWPLDQWAWPTGASASGLLPVTTQGLMRNLLAWATAQKIKLGVVHPLWILVTHSQRARSDSVQSIALSEPDGVVVFSVNDKGYQLNQQSSWHFLPSTDYTLNAQKLRDGIATIQADQSQAASFVFHVKAEASEELGLTAWTGHWRQA
jgi:hypothetical protein